MYVISEQDLLNLMELPGLVSINIRINGDLVSLPIDGHEPYPLLEVFDMTNMKRRLLSYDDALHVLNYGKGAFISTWEDNK